MLQFEPVVNINEGTSAGNKKRKIQTSKKAKPSSSAPSTSKAAASPRPPLPIVSAVQQSTSDPHEVGGGGGGEGGRAAASTAGGRSRDSKNLMNCVNAALASWSTNEGVKSESGSRNYNFRDAIKYAVDNRTQLLPNNLAIQPLFGAFRLGKVYFDDPSYPHGYMTSRGLIIPTSSLMLVCEAADHAINWIRNPVDPQFEKMLALDGSKGRWQVRALVGKEEGHVCLQFRRFMKEEGHADYEPRFASIKFFEEGHIVDFLWSLVEIEEKICGTSRSFFAPFKFMTKFLRETFSRNELHAMIDSWNEGERIEDIRTVFKRVHRNMNIDCAADLFCDKMELDLEKIVGFAYMYLLVKDTVNELTRNTY